MTKAVLLKLAGLCVASLSAASILPAFAREDRLDLMPYAGKLRQVSVRIAGEERAFLFDTGGGYTLISPAVAAAIGCTPRGRILGYRMNGERFETPLCSDVAYAIGSFMADGETVGVFDLTALLPKELPPLHGLISLKTFAGRTVALDLKANTLVVGGAVSTQAEHFTLCRVATGTDGADLTLFLGLKRDGVPYWFELDSGNLDDVRIAPHAAAAFGLDPTNKESAQPLSLAIAGASHALTGRVVDIIYDGALNAAFLEQGALSADLVKARCSWRASS